MTRRFARCVRLAGCGGENPPGSVADERGRSQKVEAE
jgi:hypothetical protein